MKTGKVVCYIMRTDSITKNSHTGRASGELALNRPNEGLSRGKCLRLKPRRITLGKGVFHGLFGSTSNSIFGAKFCVQEKPRVSNCVVE